MNKTVLLFVPYCTVSVLCQFTYTKFRHILIKNIFSWHIYYHATYQQMTMVAQCCCKHCETYHDCYFILCFEEFKQRRSAQFHFLYEFLASVVLNFPNCLWVFDTCRKFEILYVYCKWSEHTTAQAYSLCIFIQTMNLDAFLFYFIFCCTHI